MAELVLYLLLTLIASFMKIIPAATAQSDSAEPDTSRITAFDGRLVQCSLFIKTALIPRKGVLAQWLLFMTPALVLNKSVLT